MKNILLIVIFSPLLLAGQPVTYPYAKCVDQEDDYFGTKVKDPYRWLEYPDSADTRQWVEAERSLTSLYFSTIPFRSGIRNKIKKIAEYDHYDMPVYIGEYCYYGQIGDNEDNWVIYRRKGIDGLPEKVLDPSTMSGDHTTRLLSYDLSKDGRFMSYQISRAGSDWSEIYVKDLQTLRTTSDHIEWVKFSHIVWQGQGFYYCQYPAPEAGKEMTSVNRNEKVLYHAIGGARDSIVYQSTEPDQYYKLSMSEDEKYLFIAKRNDLYGGNALIYRHRDSTSFESIVNYIGAPFFKFICADSQHFIIETGAGANNNKVMIHDIATHTDRNFIPESNLRLGNMTSGGGKLFLTYQQEAGDQVLVYNMNGEKENEVSLPGPGTVEGFDGEVGDTVVYYGYTSYIQPFTIYRYNILSKASSVYRSSGAHFDPSGYEIRQLFYKNEGVKVPMYVITKKGLDSHTPHPMILTGYGGFGISLRSSFDPYIISFIELGGIYAVAGIRGGGEYGGSWHKAGSGINKINSFNDFIAAAKYLVKKRYTDNAHLAILGGSNGGLLIAACVNKAPGLCKVAVAMAPVTDMLRFHKYTAGIHWVREYGSSDNPFYFKELYAYSPLHNIKSHPPYPAMLITTADHDDRVVPAHAYKYTAALQKVAGPATVAPLLIRIDTDSGHSSSSARKALDLHTDIYSFIFYNIGVVPKL